MSRDIKQIYVGLEICESEIKLLAGEYYNTRFNILRSDKYTTNAISDFKINNKQELLTDLRNAIDSFSNKIGAKVEQVILLIPAYNFKRYPLKSKVVIESGVVKKEDIARAITNSLRTKVESNYTIVNAVVNKYSFNGRTTKKLPEKEITNEVIVDIDLLCADSSLCMDYVTIVESAGVKVLDICLNDYASAVESGIIEESYDHSVILVNINKPYTFMNLISKGRVVSTEIVYDGLNSFINRIYRTYSVPYKDISKLIKYSLNYECEYPDDIVYAWSDQGFTRSMTTRMLNDALEKPLEVYTDKILSMSKPILESGATMLVTGEGVQMRSLTKMLIDKCGDAIRTYSPSTIGVRDPSFTSLYGAFFVYRDKVLMNNLNVKCIDLLKYDSLIDTKELDSEGDTITTKIKNLFKQYIDKGDE